MKRNDAIKKLQWWTVRHDEAERLLTFIEKELGMLPPTHVIFPNSYNKSEGTYGIEVNGWEDEDPV